MKRWIFSGITGLVGIVLTLASLEVMAIAWLTIEEGRYTPAAQLFDRTQNTYVRDLTSGSACRYVDTLYPHPYLGYVHHGNPPCGRHNVNNVGLFNEDFPTVRRSDRYVVLLTGGSVASQLGQNWASPAPRYLEEELNARYVSPSGQPFLVLNGGNGGWKQPQQFILFALHASAVDAVITLDGYNERFFFWPAPWPGATERLEAPLSNFIEVNPFAADENFGDAAIGWVMGRIAGKLASTPIFGHSHAAYMVVRSIESIAKSKDFFRSTKKTTLVGLFSMPEEIRRDNDLEFTVQIGLYRKYTRGIEAIARDHNVKTAYFLQPVPAWGKKLTEEERKVVGELGYRDEYRRMVAGMLVLRENSLPIHDLGDLLRDEPRSMYADEIHFIQLPDGESPGYRLMAARIGEILSEVWGLESRTDSQLKIDARR
jgi:hypothetical protein